MAREIGEHVVRGERWVEDQVGYLFRRAAAAMANDWAEHAGAGDLRPVQISMLSIVAAEPGIAQGELGAALGIQRTNTAPLVAQLVDDGLIDRHPSPADGRRVELHLTAAGRAAWDRGRDLIEAHEARMTAGLSPVELQTLRDLLRRIIP